MSASESSIGAPAAAPPPSAPAAPSAPVTAPQSPGTAPVPAPQSADTGAVPPVIADAIAVPVVPGAPSSEPARPKTIEEARAAFEIKSAAIQAQGDTQPQEAAPAEVQQPEAELEAAPVEEPPVPVAAKPEAAPTPETGSEDLDSILTAEAIEASYPRADKKLKAELVKREAHRGELVGKVQAIGGDPGLKLAEALNPIIWNENPTTDDVDAFFDALVLPENAGAGKLFDLMGKHLVNTQLQDPDTGRDFGSNMLKEEFGKQPDNQADYDLPFVESVINLHKSWGVGEDGKPIDFATVDTLVKGLKSGAIDLDYVKSELADGESAAKPDPEKLKLQQELDELKAGKTAEATAKETAEKAEETRTRESNKAVYKTQARAYVSRQLLNEVMPLAVSANWAPSEGDSQSGPKTTLGKLVSAYVNSELMGSSDTPTPQYAEIMQMIEENSAFDATGKPTPRFMVKLAPFKTRAKALFAGVQKDLNPLLKFTAQNSRNAQLANRNGGNKTGADHEPPPIATSEPKPADRELTFEEKATQLREKYRKEEARILAEANAGQL